MPAGTAVCDLLRRLSWYSPAASGKYPRCQGDARGVGRWRCRRGRERDASAVCPGRELHPMYLGIYRPR